MNSREHAAKYRRTSEELAQDPVYLRKLFGLNNDRQIRSFPASPKQLSRDDEGYASERRSNRNTKYNKIPYKRDSALVMVANIPQRPSYRQQQTGAPYPYQISEDPVPRRSTLTNGVRFVDDPKLKENSRYTAEKPIEDYPKPRTSNGKHDSTDQDINQNGIKNSDKDNKNIEKSDENALKSDPVRKSIIRFRPHSSGSCGPLNDKVKIMNFRAEETPPVPGKYVHRIPLKTSKHTQVLMTTDGRKLEPVHADKLRRSSIEPEIETRQIRYSVAGSENLAGLVDHRKSILCRESVNERRNSDFRDNVEQEEDTNFPFDRETKPVIYAVPVVTTRGRSKSVLEQSMKSLTSKSPGNEPAAYRKNIRYSMDNDVFSAEVRRRSVGQPPQGYVNMEKGQPMLVSELLNPITSLFVTDLKDPVPKDPLVKPEEGNVWVKPRRQSVQRRSVSRQYTKPTPQVQVTYQQAPRGHLTPVKRRQSRVVYYDYQDEAPTSSEENIEVYRKKSKRGAQRKPYYQQNVYAAHTPQVTLPEPSNTGKNPSFKKVGKPRESIGEQASSKDFCGLSCETPEDETAPPRWRAQSNVKMVSSAMQTDVDDEMDLMCYPSENFLKNSALPAESGSKLRWRIIIKRGEEN